MRQNTAPSRSQDSFIVASTQRQYGFNSILLALLECKKSTAKKQETLFQISLSRARSSSLDAISPHIQQSNILWTDHQAAMAQHTIRGDQNARYVATTMHGMFPNLQETVIVAHCSNS